MTLGALRTRRRSYDGFPLLGVEPSWSLDLPVDPTATALDVEILASYAFNVGLRAHHKLIYGALLGIGWPGYWTRT